MYVFRKIIDDNIIYIAEEHIMLERIIQKIRDSEAFPQNYPCNRGIGGVRAGWRPGRPAAAAPATAPAPAPAQQLPQFNRPNQASRRRRRLGSFRPESGVGEPAGLRMVGMVDVGEVIAHAPKPCAVAFTGSASVFYTT